MDHHLELLHAVQHSLQGGLVSLGGERDPVEASAQRIHPTGFQVQGEATSRIECLGEWMEIVMQRFPTSDYNEAGPLVGGHFGCLSQVIDWMLRVPLGGPRVLGIAPGTAHGAAG